MKSFKEKYYSFIVISVIFYGLIFFFGQIFLDYLFRLFEVSTEDVYRYWILFLPIIFSPVIIIASAVYLLRKFKKWSVRQSLISIASVHTVLFGGWTISHDLLTNNACDRILWAGEVCFTPSVVPDPVDMFSGAFVAGCVIVLFFSVGFLFIESALLIIGKLRKKN